MNEFPTPSPSDSISDGDEYSSRLERFWMLSRDDASTTSSSPIAATQMPPAWSFGDSPELADLLLALTLSGEKTATASAKYEYEADGDPLPRPGDLSIVLDGSDEPRALIRTTDVTVVPFDAVSAEHARLEGEGDQSLEYWRAEHERCWRGTLVQTTHEFDTRMPVVCERFELLYPRSESAAS